MVLEVTPTLYLIHSAFSITKVFKRQMLHPFHHLVFGAFLFYIAVATIIQ